MFLLYLQLTEFSQIPDFSCKNTLFNQGILDNSDKPVFQTDNNRFPV
jgi:hypothetical protein